ncbi:hypothetical protein [Paenibacillus lentus]|nr:hypothetical protein [Paenibacillus lentus]
MSGGLGELLGGLAGRVCSWVRVLSKPAALSAALSLVLREVTVARQSC